MPEELIGEFKGKNTAYRVLPDGKMEVITQGTGKILGVDAFLMSTALGTMSNGVFIGAPIFLPLFHVRMANLHSDAPDTADCSTSTFTGFCRTASQNFSTNPREQLQKVFDTVSPSDSPLSKPQ